MAQIRKIYNDSPSLADLLIACKRNEQTAQKILFERYAGLVLTTCRRYSTSHYPSKDLLQDTFIKVFERIHQFDDSKGAFKSWITRIAINLALNSIRDRKIKIVDYDNDFEQAVDNERLSSELSEEKILAIINKLPIGYKTVFNLFVIDGFSHQEIANKLNISVSTSKSQLFKAKRNLQLEIIELQKGNYGGLR